MFVAKWQMAICLTHTGRRETAFFAKPQQGRFMGKDELKHAGQKARLARSGPDSVGLDTCERQEARQKFRVGCDERQCLYRKGLRLFA